MPLNISYELAHPKTCNLCGGRVVLLKSPKYKSGYMYSCENCHAQVGTYPKNPDVAMGILADSETREMRIKVHKLLDRFWRSQGGRTKRYEKLAEELGIEPNDCHLAYMQLDTLKQAEQILLRWWREKYDI